MLVRLWAYLRQHHIALLALFVALSGTAYAAVSLPRHSVGSAQLKNGSVGTAQLRNRSVTPPKVAASTIRLFKGQKGDPGPQGLPGPKGAPGPASVVYRGNFSGLVNPGADSRVTATCNAGETVVGGGGGWFQAGSPAQYIPDGTVSASGPSTASGAPNSVGVAAEGWTVAARNTAAIQLQLAAYAACAQ